MSEQSRGKARLASALILFAAVFVAAAHRPLSAIAASDATQGISAWGKISTVLQYPRCLNCHQRTSPLQEDDARPHVPAVVGGPDGTGSGGKHCSACHKDSGNDPITRTPGAPHWRLAPTSMTWQGLSSAQLCALLKDPKRNGGRDGVALIQHMNAEPLVLWGWTPGVGLKPVPIAHEDFMKLMHQWVASGMPCPA